jgi:carbon storage regulator CsrA
MLVVHRKIGQRILIEGGIIVEVAGIDGRGQVKLGIEAPKDVRVAREEVAHHYGPEIQCLARKRAG